MTCSLKDQSSFSDAHSDAHMDVMNKAKNRAIGVGYCRQRYQQSRMPVESDSAIETRKRLLITRFRKKSRRVDKCPATPQFAWRF